MRTEGTRDWARGTDELLRVVRTFAPEVPL